MEGGMDGVSCRDFFMIIGCVVWCGVLSNGGSDSERVHCFIRVSNGSGGRGGRGRGREGHIHLSTRYVSVCVCVRECTSTCG